MADRIHNKARCDQVGTSLSAYVDGELAEPSRLEVERHLEACPACRQELEELQRLSSLLQHRGRQIGQAPAWESVVRRVVDRSRPAGLLRAWRRADFALAASLGAIAILGLVAGLLVRGRAPGISQGDDSGPAQVEILTAGLPGLDTFLTARRAEEVAPQELADRLSFDPQIPEELPGGFRLAKTYVVSDRCCAGTSTIYRRGDDVVCLIQQPSSHPVVWDIENLEGCIIAGRSCRRGSDRQIELVQIEPEGQNLTIVAKTGAIDAAAFVRALSVD